MFKPLFRRSTGSTSQEEEDSLSSSSKQKISKSEKSSSKNNKNPYAMGGRDTFANVLADLDKQRRTIYEQVGTQDISKVRFGYQDSKKWVPIVVRTSKDQIEDRANLVQSKDKHVTHISEILNKSHAPKKLEKVIEEPRVKLDEKVKNNSFFNDSIKYLSGWMQPSHEFLIVLVLVLSCLGVYGRLFAIICTCIWWFLVPRLKKERNVKGSMKKERRLSEGNLESDEIKFPKSKHNDVKASPKSKHLSPGSPVSNLSRGSSPKVTSPVMNWSPGLSSPRPFHVSSKSC